MSTVYRLAKSDVEQAAKSKEQQVTWKRIASTKGPGALSFTNGMMTGVKYVETLRNHMEPSADFVSPTHHSFSNMAMPQCTPLM